MGLTLLRHESVSQGPQHTSSLRKYSHNGSAGYDDEGPIKMKPLPRLLVVAMEDEKRAPQFAQMDTYEFTQIVERITATLPSQGTIVVGLPRPWWTLLQYLCGEDYSAVSISDDGGRLLFVPIRIIMLRVVLCVPSRDPIRDPLCSS